MSPIVELRHLRYFIAVAEAGSFRLASERINITPQQYEALREGSLDGRFIRRLP